MKTIDELTEQECRDLLKEIQLDVICAKRCDGDVGEDVDATLTKAGLQTEFDRKISDLGVYMGDDEEEEATTPG